MKELLQNKFFRFVQYVLTLILLTTVFVSSYVAVTKLLGSDVYTINISQDLNAFKRGLNDEELMAKGVRVPKINAKYDLPKDILSEVSYKDIRLISTKSRPFSQNEIALMKVIIDLVPEKLFEYRPWAIVSTSFTDSNIAEVNPEGVAFSSGPYVFVGDVTFQKQNTFDTGTFRGLVRVISHEFVHSAQFFETKAVPDSFTHSYLENSGIVKDWIANTGWQKVNDRWTLKDNEQTTDYGKSNPVEDMADSIGSLVIGEEYSISKSRTDWALNWLGMTRDEVLQGTIPLSTTIKQRRIEEDDNKLLQKYKNVNAIEQDILNFQSSQVISKREFANYYAAEFKKRGWTGSINTLGVGEFIYLNKYKVNMEMDNNPLRVVTMIVTVY